MTSRLVGALVAVAVVLTACSPHSRIRATAAPSPSSSTPGSTPSTGDHPSLPSNPAATIPVAAARGNPVAWTLDAVDGNDLIIGWSTMGPDCDRNDGTTVRQTESTVTIGVWVVDAYTANATPQPTVTRTCNAILYHTIERIRLKQPLGSRTLVHASTPPR